MLGAHPRDGIIPARSILDTCRFHLRGIGSDLPFLGVHDRRSGEQRESGNRDEEAFHVSGVKTWMRMVAVRPLVIAYRPNELGREPD